MKSWFGRFIALAVTVAIFSGVTWALFNWQNLVDRFVASTYQPSSEMQQIVDTLQLTDEGKFYFFAAQPALNDRKDFNNNCSHRDKESIILGCYVPMQHIFIFDIDDERLTGVKEVTSAHEMLHVAYDRLSASEKDEVNKLLESELSSITNEGLQERLAVYERTEPGEKFNELHSIIGTEIASINPELEEYYKQYFEDRKAIAQMANRYEQLFNELQQQQEGLAAEVDALAVELNQRVSNYNAEIDSLNSDISDFNQKARSGYFEGEASFNIARSELITRQDQLENERSAIEGLEQRYEQKRSQLEALNSEAESLNKTIDSRLEPVPSI